MKKKNYQLAPPAAVLAPLFLSKIVATMGLLSATPPHLRVISSSSQLGHCFLSQFSTAASSSSAARLSVGLSQFCPMHYNSNADESITHPVAVTFCN